ncbi:MAG: hypothetical protein JRS35_00300 [Deltaproteobacteria bacterium]|nr:hypothetical protein [Deltaproteobacteria bacterium]
MGGIHIDLGRIGGTRTGAASVAVVALGLALFLVDFVALRGERVAHDRAAIGGEPALLEIQRPGEKHLVEITTRRRQHGKTHGRAIAWRLEDPSGIVVQQDSELTAHKERYFSFTPNVPGQYVLHVQGGGLVFKSASGSADVDVFVNDRRILARLFSAF